jgi:hypothetical protein
MHRHHIFKIDNILTNYLILKSFHYGYPHSKTDWPAQVAKILKAGAVCHCITAQEVTLCKNSIYRWFLWGNIYHTMHYPISYPNGSVSTGTVRTIILITQELQVRRDHLTVIIGYMALYVTI